MEQDECLFLLIFHLVSGLFWQLWIFLLQLSTHVGLCWPFVLVFAASVPVFSPSFSSGFGGLFKRSYLLVLSLELSYIFSWSNRCFLLPLFLASIIALQVYFLSPVSLIALLYMFFTLLFAYLLIMLFFFYFCVILVFVAWFLIMVLLLLPFLFFHCA
uniref:Uncharacterized protein n=1 Tax=Populus trichocarpa TaxID=3694 RepID=A0A3N7ELN1_POPTR